MTALEAFDRFKTLSMATGRGLTLDSVIAYVLAWDRMELLCSRAKPSDGQLRKLFIRGLRPVRLPERVEFSEPDTLARAKALALEHAGALLRMLQEVQSLPGVVTSASRPKAPEEQKERLAGHRDGNSVSSRRETVSSGPGPTLRASVSHSVRPSPEIRCHGCGHLGHMRPGCPNKSSPGWFKEGVCPAPLSVHASRAPQVKVVSPGAGRDELVPRVHLRLISDDALNVSGSDGGCREAVSGFSVSALLDTGASVSLVSEAVYRRLLTLGRVRPEPKGSYRQKVS